MIYDSKFFEDLDSIPFANEGDRLFKGREETFNSSFLKLFDKYDGIVFYDTETTGLDAQGVDELGQPLQIIELSAMRVEKVDGEPKPVAGMDEYIKMNDNGVMPQSIIDFNTEHNTGITAELIAENGISEKEAVNMFDKLTKGNVLMVAYNAQFDMCFVHEMLQRSGIGEQKNIIHSKDHLDPLTIYRDRSPFIVGSRLDGSPLPEVWDEETQQMKKALPNGHKLEFAIAYYGVDNYVQNSHRAIDDVKAMYAVTRKLDEQRSDLDSYVGIIGFNPKYGLSGMEHPNITYCPQKYIEKTESYPRARTNTVPSIVRTVQGRIPETMNMRGLATELSTFMSRFKKELLIAEATSRSNLEIAKIEGKWPSYINRLTDALVKQEQFPAFKAISGGIYLPGDFAKMLIEGKDPYVSNTKAFLKEIQDAQWVSSELKFEGKLLEEKYDELSQELKLAPELKTGKVFDKPKELAFNFVEDNNLKAKIRRPIQTSQKDEMPEIL